MNRSQEGQLTPTQLNELVYEQWLMAEIQESSLPRLPEELGNTDICKLEGLFNLQVVICIHFSLVVFSRVWCMIRIQSIPSFRDRPPSPRHLRSYPGYLTGVLLCTWPKWGPPGQIFNSKHHNRLSLLFWEQAGMCHLGPQNRKNV